MGMINKAGVAILVSDTINIKTKTVKERRALRNDEGSSPTNIKFVNIYASSMKPSKYIKQILTDIKGEIDSNTIIVGNFNTHLTSMDRLSRQKIN